MGKKLLLTCETFHLVIFLEMRPASSSVPLVRSEPTWLIRQVIELVTLGKWWRYLPNGWPRQPWARSPGDLDQGPRSREGPSVPSVLPKGPVEGTSLMFSRKHSCLIGDTPWTCRNTLRVHRAQGPFLFFSVSVLLGKVQETRSPVSI